MKSLKRRKRRSQKTVPVRYIVYVVCGLLILGALTIGLIELHAAGTANIASQAQPGNVCDQANILQAEENVPLASTSLVQLPKGMPQTAAIVNGQSISSTDLEAQVKAISTNHRAEMASLPGDVASMEPALHTSIKQIRQDTLNQMINNKLLLQEGARSGKTVSSSAAQAYMRQIITSVNRAAQTSSTYIQFMAYLCANNLTETSFLNCATIIQEYRSEMTIRTVENSYQRTHFVQGPGIITSTQDAVKSYIASLRQHATIKIFVPANMLE